MLGTMAAHSPEHPGGDPAPAPADGTAPAGGPRAADDGAGDDGAADRYPTSVAEEEARRALMALVPTTPAARVRVLQVALRELLREGGDR